MIMPHDHHYLKEELYTLVREAPSIFEFLQRGSLDGIWYWDLRDPEHEWMSPRFWETLGYDPAEKPHSPAAWQDLIHQDDLQSALDNFHKHCQDPTHPYDQIVRYRHRDGSTVWIRCRGMAIRDEHGVPTRMLGAHNDLTKVKQAEESLRFERSQLLSIFESIPAVISITDPQTYELVFMNTFGRDLYPDAHSGNRCYQVFHQSETPCAQCNNQRLLESNEEILVWEYYSGVSKKHFECVNRLFTWPDGRKLKLELSFDITERKHLLEEQQILQKSLLQAQKMEAVGNLAGGIAHDFNNMLSVIAGYAEMAMERFTPEDPVHGDLTEILAAANRSADITRQLLAFARQQTIKPQVLDLNKTLKQMLRMLRRLIGEDLVLSFKPDAKVWPVYIDPSQVDQVLANLCVNARDAIEGVGTICIETGSVTFDQEYCTDHTGFVPGDFVMLAVSDNGCGMSEETLARAFEPFYTTKGLGKGTGLGLATVYGIMKQNNGFVNIYSEGEKGSTIRLYFPRHRGDVAAFQDEECSETLCGGDETVLLVEDDAAILELTRVLLEKLGYTVLIGNTPSEGLRVAREYPGEIALLVTDVVMPEMNGRQLSAVLRKDFPNLKTLYMSGYTADVIVCSGVLDEGICFLEKPFSKRALAAKVRETLSAVQKEC